MLSLTARAHASSWANRSLSTITPAIMAILKFCETEEEDIIKATKAYYKLEGCLNPIIIIVTGEDAIETNLLLTGDDFKSGCLVINNSSDD